jgi:serine/threonine protein kinase/TolB-like protein/Tfp pilus assembly protein PilF
MTPARWQQVRAVFQEAVDCDPEARAAFLQERCGQDEELRREVESLLASDQDPGTILEGPAMAACAMGVAGLSVGEADWNPLIFKDRYKVQRELGRGGMSVVYLATDRQLLEKPVVVKVLLEETGSDPWIQKKFLQEMEALARIDHPGVVGVLDTGLTAGGKQFLVMQYIQGTTLRSAMKPGGMAPLRAASIIRQIGQALAAAHEKGVWHRDLKPENIMLQSLGGEDHVKLIDFGIAGIQDSRFAGERTRVAGTLSYMAPEQLNGRPCAASDTYALGTVAFEILTGRLPGDSTESRPRLPVAAEKSIQKARSFRPEFRQTGIREFSEELYYALTGSETGRRPTKSADSAPSGSVEIAHVLFIDLVNYSLLPMDRQKQHLEELQQIVHESAQFRTAEEGGDIITLPTGDGMAMAFFGDPTAPVVCALEVAAALKSTPHLHLRMGIHSGPVYRVADVNSNINVAGGGINMAQRVMDCGDAGHILVSNTVADVLLQLSQWSPYLTNLGEFTVKHGVKVHLYRLATGELGNPERPRKLVGRQTPKARSKILMAAALAVVLLAAAGGFWWARGRKGSQAVQDIPSIAVLPFVDRSPEKNQEYLSDGVAEQILNSLVKLDGLRVVGRTSSFQFRGTKEDYRSISKKLNVAAILEGSVGRQGNRARITVGLIHASDGFNLWSSTYDRSMDDIFDVQDSIARAVTEALKVKLLGNRAPVPATRSTNADSYNAYLQGLYFLKRNDKESLEHAVSYFEQAIKVDGKYAPSWVGLAEAHSELSNKSYLPTEAGYRQARKEIETALVLDPNLGEAHLVLGRIKMLHDFDWIGADAAYQRALELEPGKSSVLSQSGILARSLGRLDAGVALGRRAIQTEPLSPAVYHNAGVSFYYAGLNGEAVAAFEKALELVPQRAVTHCTLGAVRLAQGQPGQALEEARQEKNAVLQLRGLALAYHALGRKNESDASLAELIAKFRADGPFMIATVYAFRGEKDRAFAWLDRAYAERDSGLLEIKDPLLKGLKGDPRYTELLKRLRLPW